jgi:hypothetical protein
VKNKKIFLKYITGMIISAIIFLFIHSELHLFDDHTDICKNTDLCLILDSVNIDPVHSQIKLQKIINNFFFNIFISDKNILYFSSVEKKFPIIFYLTKLKNSLKENLPLLI